MLFTTFIRLRMHLRLCSVPVGAASESKNLDTPTSLQDIDSVIERHALHWPQKGKLVVQVNPESERSKTWLPFTLVCPPPPFLRPCLRPCTRVADPRFMTDDTNDFSLTLTPFRRQIHWTSRRVCGPEGTSFVSSNYPIFPSLSLSSLHRRRLPRKSGEIGIGHRSWGVRRTRVWIRLRDRRRWRTIQ